jgi:flagellar biosynthesis protein FlhB
MSATSKLASLATYARGRWGEPAAARVPGNGGQLQRAAQVGTVISVVVLSVVALVGVLIIAQINSALPAIQNDQLNSTSDSILSGFNGAMELFPVVLLVLVASLVIGIVQRLRR